MYTRGKRRGALAAAGSMLAGLALVPATAPASAAATLSCRAMAAYPAKWTAGYDFQFAVVNTGTEAFSAWVITFDVPPGDVIYTTWNGSVVQSGQHVVARSYTNTYNGSLAPGASAESIGGVVEGDSAGGLTNITCTPEAPAAPAGPAA
ncbi:cellulose binding domain-containing protein [Actinocrinis puniceicyclus]|nr:cellulose binding domain-containing protein [Actinocrinis puniceicyclus]